mmetsp:Transcript_4596/g.6783  ORF Transcript_4596/g.6783 Transcript_4596/m.6783 type:complete len:399 (-) Transcript_4596:24-1220(-)
MTLQNVDFDIFPSLLFGFVSAALVILFSRQPFSKIFFRQPSSITDTLPDNSSSIPRTQLIIDGCNGPIRLLEQYLPDHENSATTSFKSSQQHRAISLLRVVDGENKGDRMDVIPKLDQILSAQNVFNMGEKAIIYFDGLGNKEKANRVWDVSPHVTIKITKIVDEADNVIVEDVKDAMQNSNFADSQHERRPSSIIPTYSDCNRDKSDQKESSVAPINEPKQSYWSSSLSSLAELLQDFSKRERPQEEKVEENEEAAKSCCYSSPTIIYTITRNTEGPGRSRRILKPLQLLRPESVFCIFGCSVEKNVSILSTQQKSLQSSGVRDAKRLLTMEHKLIKSVEKRCLKRHQPTDEGGTKGSSRRMATVVVTDDVFLRQRIVNAGGFVMTFEQFWDLLVAR